MSLSEIIFLGLLGLVIFGPRKLISVGQDAGKMIGRLKTISSDFKSQLDAEISTAEAPVAASSIDKSMSGGR